MDEIQKEEEEIEKVADAGYAQNDTIENYVDEIDRGPVLDDNYTHNISIEPLNYGFKISVGCQKFAIEDPEKVGRLITEYLKNPSKVQNEWFANTFELKRDIRK